MYAGKIITKKVEKIVEELKTQKLNNLINKEPSESTEGDTKDISVESLDALYSTTRPSYNSRDVQIDAL